MVAWVLKDRLPFQESLTCVPVWRSRRIYISEFTSQFNPTWRGCPLCSGKRAKWTEKDFPREPRRKASPRCGGFPAPRDRPGPAQWYVLGFCCSGRDGHKLSQSSDLRMCASSFSKLKGILLECYFCLMEAKKSKKLSIIIAQWVHTLTLPPWLQTCEQRSI